MSDDTTTATHERTDRLAEAFDRALAALEEAPDFAKGRYQEDVFAIASDLMDSDAGVAHLAARAERFDAAGVFHAGPWERPERLVPIFVTAGLEGDGVYPTVEALSNLRVLAIANGRACSEAFDERAARAFLGEVCAANVKYLTPAGTEESRVRPKLARRARRLFERILEVVPAERVLDRIVEEIELRAAQRPILAAPLEDLVRRAAAMSADSEDGESRRRVEAYLGALGAEASERALEAGDPLDYRRAIRALEIDGVVAEARRFAERMHATGLTSPYLAVALRRVARTDPERIGEALALSESGVAEAARSSELVALLVGQTVVPETRHVVLGLAGVLERNLLSRNEVAGGLRKIADLDVRPEIARGLLERFGESSALSPSAVLLGGCISVLGQPLGVGQGDNPTCQSARGISLWSQHAPGELLARVASVARDGFYQTTFEGHEIRSDTLGGGVASRGIEAGLDPVSQVLVPHLDRVYDHMMMLAAHRSDDGHRWVNPVFYGRWIQPGFATAFEFATGRVLRHGAFVRRFFATHHPEHNDGHELIYPNPVGIMVTDSHGRLLGRHAVSIQRVGTDPSAADDGSDPVRVYFFNPNDEGRQNWGDGVRPTVAHHGERHGESSLPFEHFAARLYAFHYDPQEEGDAFAVPSDTVESVTAAAARTWGASIDGFG